MEWRIISDDSLLVQEITFSMKKSRARQGLLLGIKVDFEKAFDSLGWGFITRTLKSLGFHGEFVNWIQECRTTPNFSVFINGSPQGFFKASRGLRRGDPPSPYIFILSMEVLSGMLFNVENENKLEGIRIARRASAIGHAVDLVLLIKATDNNIRNC